MEKKKDKITIIGLILVLLLLFLDMLSTINTMSDYEKRKASGNDRWLQVENRILQTENKVNMLEKEIAEWKN